MHQAHPFQSIKLADGRELAYRIAGDPDGFPVIYNHGGTVSGLDVVTAQASAQALGLKLISPNRPGIGASTHQTDRTLANWANDVAELCEALAIKRFASLGWSMGGQYALGLAAFMPQRVTHCVVIAGAIELTNDQAMAQLNKPDRDLTHLCQTHPHLASLVFRGIGAITDHLPQQAIKLWLDKLSDDDAAICQSFDARFLADCMAEAMQQPQGMVEEYCAWARPWGFDMRDIGCQLDCFAGASDNLIDPTWAKAMASQAPNGRYHKIDKAGHLFALDDTGRRLTFAPFKG